MLYESSLYVLLIFLPILFAPLVYVLGRTQPDLIKWIALGVFGCQAIAILALLFQLPEQGFLVLGQFLSVPQWGYYLTLQVDMLSVLMLLLSSLLLILVTFSSWDTEKPTSYFAWLIAFSGAIMGVFMTTNLIWFFIFWELTLVPMFFLIGGWGGEGRIYAAMKFFLYTHLASVLILLAFLMIYQQTGASDFTQIQEAMLATPIVIWWLLFLGFAIKLPVFPFHTWLPDAHVEAPAPISVLLAGVLLKMGGYGLLRLCIQYMPETSQYFALVMLVLGVLTAFVAAFLALNQTHLKKMVAYSSISHMGLVLVAISTLSLEGLSAALFEMLAHAVIISPLFLIAGMIHHHLHSYDLRQMGGILCQMPYLSAIFMLAAMAAVGMPATVGFVGEFTIFISVLEAFGSVMMLLAMLAILGAGYFIWAVRRSFHGAMSDLVTNTPWSVSRLAMLPLWVYAGLILLFGLYPQPLLDAIQRVFAAGGLGS